MSKNLTYNNNFNRDVIRKLLIKLAILAFCTFFACGIVSLLTAIHYRENAMRKNDRNTLIPLVLAAFLVRAVLNNSTD